MEGLGPKVFLQIRDRVHWKEMNGSELGEELEEKLISVMDEKDDDEQ